MLNTFLPDCNDANHVVFSSLDIILTLITMHGKTDVTDVLKVATGRQAQACTEFRFK